MAQSAAERRKAQRQVAKKLKRGESPLGGEFRTYAQRALEHPVTPPPPITAPPPPTIDYVLPPDEIEAEIFARSTGTGEGSEQIIPLTYYPTNTSYPSRLPQNTHPRTSAAGYNRLTNTLAVKFWTNGALYFYYNVTPAQARQFYLVNSPGDMINDILNGHPYERIN